MERWYNVVEVTQGIVQEWSPRRGSICVKVVFNTSSTVPWRGHQICTSHQMYSLSVLVDIVYMS